MMTQHTKSLNLDAVSGCLLAGFLFVLFSTRVLALGTPAGKAITNRATLDFQARVLYSDNSSTLLYSAGPSVGINLIKNLWLSAGYNFAGYRDSDFTSAGYTALGAYTRLRFKFDSGTTKDIAGWWEKTQNNLVGRREQNPNDS